MQTLRLVEGKVPLLNTKAIYNFMKEIVNYKQYLCETGIEPSYVEVDKGTYKLFKPFVDRTVPITSIKEFVWVIGLDNGGYAYYIDLIGVGSINKALVDVKEVFRASSFYAIESIILVHNHPSGDPSPSDDDIKITEKIIELGMLLECPLRDHLIICPEIYYSLEDTKELDRLSDGIIARRNREDELHKQNTKLYIDNQKKNQIILKKNEALEEKNEALEAKDQEIEKLKQLLKHTHNAS